MGFPKKGARDERVKLSNQFLAKIPLYVKSHFARVSKFTPSEGIGNSVFSDRGFEQRPIEQVSGINSSERQLNQSALPHYAPEKSVRLYSTCRFNC